MFVTKPRRADSRLPDATLPQTSPREVGGRIQHTIVLFFAVLLLVYYGVALKWSIKEVIYYIAGVALLWGPIAALLYGTLRKAIEDATVRFAFSAAGSYTLTTLLYFAAAVLHLGWLFVAALMAAGATAVWLARWEKIPIRWPRLDGVLFVIVAGSLVTTIPYSTVLRLQPSGDRVVTGIVDQFYHAGLEYELSRNVPPSQATIRGATPERAYHMFSHLTVVLLRKVTRQPDMLRVHSVYHYAAITVLICLAMYGIGFLLTGTPLGGYVCAFLPFLTAIATPPIIPNVPGYFFFTILPHATSSVFPTLFTSPQMYSGIAVMYGVLLGFAALARASRRAALVLVCGLMVAALFRFRVHCWLAAMPIFLAYVSVMWYRTKRAVWLIAAALAISVSGLLYVEMLLPVYMRGTAEVHFGLSPISAIPLYRSWPFATFVHRILQELLPAGLSIGAWQIACLTNFTIWNMLGVPLCAALVFGLRILKKSRAANYYWFTLGMIVVSMICAVFLNAGYDKYSVSAQFAYHVGWYALPVGGVCLAALISRLQQRGKLSTAVLVAAALICGIASPISQHLILGHFSINHGVIQAASWDAFEFLRERTPGESIVMSTWPLDRKRVTISGLGGRSAYLDYTPNPVNDQALRLNPQDHRARVLKELAAAPDPATYCSVITATPITHVLEEPSDRLMPNLPCLRLLFTGRDGVTSVWQVVRP
ncbi:MAG TPA: hypothetical protein VMH80_06215 [Bryobacteraceae bacterium]|nr:hypothetical protein [Bryobacteraceae bacterium]